VTLKLVLDIAVPAIVFALLTAVGLNLTPADFARVGRAPVIVAAGVFAPLVVLPALALALVWWLQPDHFVQAGLLLVAACPIGGISNTYSYLAGASTALSVTMTGLSSVVAIVAIPVITRGFSFVLHEPIGVDAPVSLLGVQLLVLLALPIGLGMWLRRRRPEVAARHAKAVQRLAFVLLGLLLTLIISAEAARVQSMLGQLVLVAAAFVVLSFSAGWLVGSVVRAGPADRFTLAAEFATRNVAVATAIAVTLLGRTEFAAFASVYFLTELPIMLIAASAWKRWQGRPEQGRGAG
jgi:BASS family bile acid:Na+ symporter